MSETNWNLKHLTIDGRNLEWESFCREGFLVCTMWLLRIWCGVLFHQSWTGPYILYIQFSISHLLCRLIEDCFKHLSTPLEYAPSHVTNRRKGWFNYCNLGNDNDLIRPHWWFVRGILKSLIQAGESPWFRLVNYKYISTLTGCWQKKSLLGALNADLNLGMVKDWWVLSTLHWFLVSCMNWRRLWFHLWLAQRSWQAGTMQWRIAFEASERLFYLFLHRVFLKVDL